MHYRPNRLVISVWNAAPWREAPWRIELWDEDVESIRRFEPATQRSLSNESEARVMLLPREEIVRPERGSSQAARTCSRVMKFSVPSSSPSPQRPQFE